MITLSRIIIRTNGLKAILLANLITGMRIRLDNNGNYYDYEMD